MITRIVNGKARRADVSPDCGIAVNPDQVRAQMEGGAVSALTAALYGRITLERGGCSSRASTTSR
jgi:isoquinoline 1-oxidoreductase beta subunit